MVVATLVVVPVREGRGAVLSRCMQGSSAFLVVVPVIVLARQQRRARLARGLASPIDGPHVADLGTLILCKPGGAQSTQHLVA